MVILLDCCLGLYDRVDWNLASHTQLGFRALLSSLDERLGWGWVASPPSVWGLALHSRHQRTQELDLSHHNRRQAYASSQAPTLTLGVPLAHVWIMFSAPCFTFSSTCSCLCKTSKCRALDCSARGMGPEATGSAERRQRMHEPAARAQASVKGLSLPFLPGHSSNMANTGRAGGLAQWSEPRPGSGYP